MNSFITRVFLVVSGVCLLLAPLHLLADQPVMRAALDDLKLAKTAADPVPLLKKAEKELQNAARNKGGFREKAIAEVDAALESAVAGDKEKTQEKIDHAISVIWAGMDVGKRNKN